MDDERTYNRAYHRVGVRTPATVITQTSECKVYKAWTDDLSPSGVRLLCEDELLDDEIFVRVTLPGLMERFFRGKIVRRDLTVLAKFQGADQTLHCYGVEFLGICSPEEAERLEQSVRALRK